MSAKWFERLWTRFQCLRADDRTVESVRSLCSVVGLFDFAVTPAEKGRFTVFRGFRVSVPTESVFLPLLPPSAIDPNPQRGTPWKNAVTECGWITPSYIQMGVLSTITSRVIEAPPELREGIVDAASRPLQAR